MLETKETKKKTKSVKVACLVLYDEVMAERTAGAMLTASLLSLKNKTNENCII